MIITMQRFYRSFRHLSRGSCKTLVIKLVAAASIAATCSAFAQSSVQADSQLDAGEPIKSSAGADQAFASSSSAANLSSSAMVSESSSTSSATADASVVSTSVAADMNIGSAASQSNSSAQSVLSLGAVSSLGSEILAVQSSSLAESSAGATDLAVANGSEKARENKLSTSSSAASLSSRSSSSVISASINAASLSSENSVASASSSFSSLPKAENMDLRKVVELSSSSVAVQQASSVSSAMASADSKARLLAPGGSAMEQSSAQSSLAASQVAEHTSSSSQSLMSLDEALAMDTSSSSSESSSPSKFLLGHEVPPNTATRLTWIPDEVPGGFTEETPVLVINGAKPGKTLCLTAAVHGDELNGIEMIRRVMFGIDAEKLTGAIIGVPVANIMGFRRNTRYLPDRRDWNRYFPGNTRGSSASRMAYSFFTKVIMKCDALVDLHTGSFHRTNLPQLRADLSNEEVAKFAQDFGSIAVLNSRGNPSSLRVAAVKAGIPAVTIEAGEPMAMQNEVVEAGTLALNSLLSKMGMYGKQRSWHRVSPVYYKSAWVRANQSGILFSRATLGKRVSQGEVLGTVTDPITNQRSEIVSPYQGRILGMALDQVVMPGFATYHIGIQTPEAILIEESQMKAEQGMEEDFELDEEDGDDADTPDATPPKANGLDQPVTKPQDSLEDE